MLSFVIKPLKSSIFGVFLFILVYYHLCNFGQNLDNVQNQKKAINLERSIAYLLQCQFVEN